MKACVIALTIGVLVAVGLPTTTALRYTVHNTPVNFFTAWQQCIAKGGALAAIETPCQNEFVYDAIKQSGGSGGWWISGTDLGLEGSWIWMSKNVPLGNVNGYMNFAPGEPSNSGTTGEHCLAIEQSPQWNDMPCDKLLNYVCEYYI
ncbi:perlucin-like [Anopheles funestus]|uniref:perlucin-like n=1 Tax=Anopheles funestus TaxID=62324 RepID=UPI0020C6DE0F|nr:perlucin-like [Anopheles funestus]